MNQSQVKAKLKNGTQITPLPSKPLPGARGLFLKVQKYFRPMSGSTIPLKSRNAVVLNHQTSQFF